jgi:hypothetical protein
MSNLRLSHQFLPRSPRRLFTMSDIENLSALISQSVQVIAKACSDRGVFSARLELAFPQRRRYCVSRRPWSHRCHQHHRCCCCSTYRRALATRSPAAEHWWRGTRSKHAPHCPNGLITSLYVQHTATVALRIAHETSVTEILRDAGPEVRTPNSIHETTHLYSSC